MPSHKNFQKALNDNYNYHESSDCFEYPKKSFLKASCRQKNLAKFSYPNKCQNRKLIILVSRNPESPPPLPPWGLERASQHLRICNCLPNVLESILKAREKLAGREKGKERGGPSLPSFLPFYFRVGAFSIQRTRLSRILEHH